MDFSFDDGFLQLQGIIQILQASSLSSVESATKWENAYQSTSAKPESKPEMYEKNISFKYGLQHCKYYTSSLSVIEESNYNMLWIYWQDPND